MPQLQRQLALGLALVVLLSLQSIPLDVVNAGDSSPPISRNIVVFFQDTPTPLELAAFRDKFQLKEVPPVLDPQIVTFSYGGATPGQTIAAIRNDSSVIAADVLTESQLATNDPVYPNEWWLKNSGQDIYIGNAYATFTSTGTSQLIHSFPTISGHDIHWEEAESLAACNGAPCRGAGETVAVVDSGIDASHPDLIGQISPASRSFISGDVNDRIGHGTFIAGLVAAKNDNGVGIAGAAPDATVMALKVTDDGSVSSVADATAIRYAAQNGATVLNLSFAGPADAVEKAAIDEVTAAPYNMIVVASAGNDAQNGNPIEYPAADEHVISVGSVNTDGIVSEFSEHNAFVDVTAPGGLITSLMASGAIAGKDCTNSGTPYQDPAQGVTIQYRGPNDCMFTTTPGAQDAYVVESGTSFSAPLVSAAATLAKEKWPAITSDQFEEAVRATADDDSSGNGPDEYYGAGTLNLARLLSYNFPPQISQFSLTAPAVTNSGSDSTTIVTKVEDLDGISDLASVTADLSAMGMSSIVPLTFAGGVYTSAPQVIPSTTAVGSYPIVVTARDQAGHTTTATSSLTVAPVGSPISSPPSLGSGATSDLTIRIKRPSKKKEIFTRKKSLLVSGDVGADAAFVEVNGMRATLDGTNGHWSAKVDLDKGKNTIDIKSYDVTRTRSDDESIDVTYDTTAPGNVADLVVKSANDHSTLTWSAPRDRDVAGYHIYDLSGGASHEVATSTTTSATVSGHGPFAVTAEDMAGNESPIDAAPRTSSASFDDVPAGYFAANAISDLAERGVVQGSGGMFRPNDPVTRAEFAKMLIGVRNQKPEGSSPAFRDVPANHTLAGYIAATVHLGWATGQAGAFYPERAVSRYEAAAMLGRAANLPFDTTAFFVDVPDPIEHAVIGAVVKAGIASGQNGRFEPYRALTRGEAAKMLDKIVVSS